MSYRIAIAATTLLLAMGVCHAAPAVYPAKGQSPEQTAQDKIACSQWATSETGFDPARTPPPTQQAAPKQRGGALRGALVGAAVGEVVDNKGGEGAAVGGLVGGMRQAKRNQQAQGQANAQYEQQMQQYGQAQAAHTNAYGLCLEARGYSVK